MNEKKRTKYNILWNTIGSVFYSGCQWLMTVLVVHLSTDYEAAGFLGLAMTTSSSFSAISLFSMRNFQISDVSHKYETRQYVGSRILTCAIALFTCVIYSFISNTWYQAICISLFMIIRVAESLSDVLHGENQKFERYDYIGKSYIIRGIITVVFFSGGLCLFKDLLVTLIIVAVLNLAVSILYDGGQTRKLEEIHPQVISKKVFELLKECAPIVIFTFLLSLENLIPKQILQQLFGTDEVGIYSTIASPTLVIQVCASVAFSPFVPEMSKLYTEESYENFRKNLHKVYIAFLILFIATNIGALLLGRWGLSILFGKDILQYYSIFMPIVWCTLLTAVIWIMSAVMVSMRKIGMMLIGMLVDFIICIITVKPLVNLYGKNGVSYVQILVYGLYIIFMIIVCEIVIQNRLRRRHDGT